MVIPGQVRGIGRTLIAAAILMACGHGAWAVEGPSPGDGPWLQYADPGLGGFDAAKLEAVRLQADEQGSGALMIIRGGLVVAAWGDIERKFKCHSMRKSFLSALYGPAVAAGKIDLGTTVAELEIEDVHGLTRKEKQATIEHLLQSRSGVYHPAAKSPVGMRQGRPDRGSAKPGARFWYNNWDFNTAGQIYRDLTGTSVVDAFQALLAEPLGMEDFQPGDGFDQYERRSSKFPAYAFRLSTRDAARFGLLYLRDGLWADERLVPEGWVRESWKPHSKIKKGRAYGYMWWIYGPGIQPSRPEVSIYAASGTGGQLIAVVPELDLVVVHRADTDFSPGLSGKLVWELVRGTIDAIHGPARRSRHLKPVESRPFSRELPPLVFPEIVALSEEDLARYTGEFRIGEETRVEMKLWDGVLVGRMTGLGETDFYPLGEHRFWSRSTGAMLEFEVGEDGMVTRGTLRFRGQEMIAERR